MQNAQFAMQKRSQILESVMFYREDILELAL